jgi:hypothetical protein
MLGSRRPALSFVPLRQRLVLQLGSQVVPALPIAARRHRDLVAEVRARLAAVGAPHDSCGLALRPVRSGAPHALAAGEADPSSVAHVRVEAVSRKPFGCDRSHESARARGLAGRTPWRVGWSGRWGSNSLEAGSRTRQPSAARRDSTGAGRTRHGPESPKWRPRAPQVPPLTLPSETYPPGTAAVARNSQLWHPNFRLGPILEAARW